MQIKMQKTVCWEGGGTWATSAPLGCGQEGERKSKKRDNCANPDAATKRVWRVTPSRGLCALWMRVPPRRARYCLM